MELGGKSPLIIFADSDLKNAVAAAMMANFYSVMQCNCNGIKNGVERGGKKRLEEKSKNFYF